MINLWDPQHVGLALALLTAVLLGMVHGTVPDEHTWPITFSYAVGSYSTRGGARAGLTFSAAFTLQRALAAELAYFVLGGFQFASRWGYAVYAVVGLVMAGSGRLVLTRAHQRRHDPVPPDRHSDRVVARLPALHGFLAGWGVGAFAAIVYTVLVPAMPSAWLGWAPGALFGLGTTITQVLMGAAFGGWMSRRRVSEPARRFLGQFVAGRTLLGGGVAFVVVALAGLTWPRTINRLAIRTGLHVHNLDRLDVGFFLAVPVVLAVAMAALRTGLRELRTAPLATRTPDPAIT
ncbi:MAG: hypothetical protein ACYDAQ_15665 [Mycobacteriales bacterium]